jgi:hypothetical protein
VPAADQLTRARLLALERTPIGVAGNITSADDGMPEWQAA